MPLNIVCCILGPVSEKSQEFQEYLGVQMGAERSRECDGGFVT
jgi:hypothetical protein